MNTGEMCYDLTEMLGDLEGTHSTYQVRNFIVGRIGLTPYGMYKQCLMELQARIGSIRTAAFKIKEVHIKRDALTVKKEDLLGKIHDIKQQGPVRRDFNLQLKVIDSNIEAFHTSMQGTFREFLYFWRLAKHLKNQLGEITPENRVALERESWIRQAQVQASSDLVIHGRISEKGWNLLFALPPVDREQVIKHTRQGTEALQSWLLALDPNLPSEESLATTYEEDSVPTLKQLEEYANGSDHDGRSQIIADQPNLEVSNVLGNPT